MQLKILIKQAYQYNPLQNMQLGYYAGTNPQNLQFTAGALPAFRQWQNYGQYLDVTNEVDGLNKLTLTWTAERDENGFLIPGTIFSKKSSSGQLTFYGQTFSLLKQWLIDDVSAPLNSVDVKIQHYENGVLCGTYEDYAITSEQLTYCDTINLCEFSVTLKQKDEILNCIKRTMITDNWQGWFPENNQTPSNGKKHPRFSYCNEQRPNGVLIALWWNMAILGIITNSVLASLFIALNSIIFAINGVINSINAIINFINSLGANINTIGTINYFDPKTLIENFANQFIETGGCGREHPAPLIRDYITNVCDKCGVKYDADTIPIFFAQQITIQTSDVNRGNGGTITANNPHYNACYLFPQTSRGIRRFDKLDIFGASPNTTSWWIPENAPLLTLDMFLDELKTLYNAEWRLSTKKINGIDVPYLYFQRRDFYFDTQTIYDFTANSPDRDKIVYGVCSEFNDKKYPAALKGLYTTDATDVCGNEARGQHNSVVDFGKTAQNPNYSGLLDITAQYGASRFRFDGAGNDYIFDAMQVVINGSVFTPFLVGTMIDIVYPAFRDYAEYVLLLKHDLTTFPKVIIWDGERYENARVIKPKACKPVNAAIPMPEINTPFNNYPASEAWDVKHPPKTFVIGSSLSFASQQNGYYTLQDYFGVKQVEKQALLVNYPMYFTAEFKDGLWDWFHWIDDPNKRPVMNQTHTIKIELCCDDLKTLGLFGALNNVKLAQKIKIPSQFYPDAQITEITVSYDDENTYGKWIEIKCRV